MAVAPDGVAEEGFTPGDADPPMEDGVTSTDDIISRMSLFFPHCCNFVSEYCSLFLEVNFLRTHLSQRIKSRHMTPF